MTSPRLTVVIPTRNRPQALFRVLESISGQTLPPMNFDVVVVDDGSDPPLNAASVTEGFHFRVTLLRRTEQPGAHASRCAGLRAARGRRVLFLDDDIVLQPAVLAEHAAVQDDFAVGPILYEPESISTPFQRYQAIRYAADADAVARQGPQIPAEKFYICNASGPRERLSEVMEGVSTMVGGMPIPGDGCDEVLICHQLMKSGFSGQFLADALVLHIDTKTVEQARHERLRSGMTVCRLMLEIPELRQTNSEYAGVAAVLTGGAGFYRMWRVRLIWIAPHVFRWGAEILTKAADRGPPHWIPMSTCNLPLAVAFWEGVRKAAPSFGALQTALRDGSEGE